MGYTKRSDLEMVSLQSAEESMTRRGRIAESLIALERPDLIDLFLTYQNEAIAARKFLESSLIELDPGGEVLEVGGGILALAIQLASEGFRVTSVEPVGEGFIGITYIMKIFTEIAKNENLKFNLVESPIEDCRFNHKFDFIFSINVMEHLKDPYLVLIKIVDFLASKGKYRFFCPNYDFPYEPHYSKWIFRRMNNAYFLSESRAATSKLDYQSNPGLYRSLNYLTVKKLRGAFKDLIDMEIRFNKIAFYDLARRAMNDSVLANRHKKLATLVQFIDLVGLLPLLKMFPCEYSPIIDAEISFKVVPD